MSIGDCGLTGSTGSVTSDVSVTPLVSIVCSMGWTILTYFTAKPKND